MIQAQPQWTHQIYLTKEKSRLKNGFYFCFKARIGFALIFGVWLNWGCLGFWFGATLAELVPIIIGVIFYWSLEKGNPIRKFKFQEFVQVKHEKIHSKN